VTVGNFGNGVWTNTAGGDWGTAANWNNSAVANGSGFNANFSQLALTADTTVTLDATWTVGGLTFGATGGSTHNWILSGSPLTLAPGLPLLTGVAATVPSIAVTNAATLDVAVDSTNGLAETGTGVLVLAGGNSIVGPLNLNGGELSFSSLNNLPLSATGISAVNFGGGGLQWGVNNTLDITSQGISFTFPGSATFDTGANNVILANSFGDGGVGGLKKLGTGTLTLDGSVSYTGTTTVSNGVLALGSSGSISSSTNIIVLSNGTLMGLSYQP
jgi:fibronectin-binding autotransporter adhesin